ncbi:nucleoside recognition domain-containing protein [Tannerella sp.]|uniref:nucleoside recognition domain-containing protein n=1 Tax=Tannerella sp. TaxID=2382127 RepID=UPI003FA1A935
METVGQRIGRCIRSAVPKACRTCFWLLKIILPVSLLVRLLQYSGILAQVSVFLEPAFSFIGLPGETAIIFLTSVFTPLYAPMTLIASMPLTVREVTLIALMCLVSHNLLVECAVQGKTGSSFVGMFALRVVMSFVIAFAVHRIMPYEGYDTIVGSAADTDVCTSLADVFILWLKSSLSITLLCFVIVSALMILHYLLEEFRLLKSLSKAMTPVMMFFGLPRNCSFLWLVGNIVGLSYGSAIMMEQLEANKISRRDGNLLNYHLAISHSQLEDTLIFAAIGAPFLWVMLTRMVFALLVVWIKRLLTRLPRYHYADLPIKK